MAATQDLHTEELVVNMGPHHPSTHGVCRMILKLDGEVVDECEPVIGYLHRAIEKMCEKRTYAQVIPVMDRFECVDVHVTDLSPAIATHAGPGTLGIAICP